MTVPEPPVVMHAALRRLAEEARQRLAALEPKAQEREFYVGVMTAAEDLARTGRAAVRPVERESRAFRDGYLEVSNLVAAAAGHVPSRFPLPTPHHSGAAS